MKYEDQPRRNSGNGGGSDGSPGGTYGSGNGGGSDGSPGGTYGSGSGGAGGATPQQAAEPRSDAHVSNIVQSLDELNERLYVLKRRLQEAMDFVVGAEPEKDGANAIAATPSGYVWAIGERLQAASQLAGGIDYQLCRLERVVG